MTIQNDPLLREITRRNWSILVLLTVLSLFWWSLEVSLGVLAGGLLAILGHHLRERSLRKMLTQPHPGSTRGFQFGYIVRLAFLGSGIYLLIVKAQLPPLAVAAGLSVVILNIVWMAFKRFP
ncbi:MAG: ATP synthase subunit I [Desulfuromonadales bacterium]|nr:ATP synthase subunit I [Desulfuromonadales bacterium]